MNALFSSCCLLLLPLLGVAQGTQLLREPTVSKDAIVFSYANDLWKVSRKGGDAIRLTSNEGAETQAHFSRDGQYIAFSAQYEGNTDVYVIPADGGTPQRLTWHPGSDYVQGWTPDGKVVFQSRRHGHPTQLYRLYTVPRTGGFPEALPAPRAAYGELSPNGQQLAYLPITSWDPEWRNYRGGQAMPIWILDLNTLDLQRTPQKDKERHLDPSWFGENLFYLSERDYTSNIWSYNPKTKAEKQHTFHIRFDVKSMDACEDAIVYEQGGYLHLLDPQTGESTQLEINVKGDASFERPRWEKVNARGLSNPQLSANGKRAAFEYRGEIFSFPKEEGAWRNLSKNAGAADRSPVWSPEGKKIAWFTDANGEYALHIAEQYGKKLKTFPMPNPTFYFRPVWSPDGKWIAYTDTDYKIWIRNVENGELQKADTDRYAHPNRAMNPVWSPDGQWIAYAKQLESHFKAIFAYNVRTAERIQLTDGMADAITPVWDQSGDYLYLLGSTNYGLNSGWLDMSSYDPDTERALYCIVLAEDGKAPTLLQSDEAFAEKEAKSEEKKAAEKDKKDKGEQLPEVRIDKAGILKRMIALDLPTRRYGGLVAAPKGHVFVIENIPNEGRRLHLYKVEKQEAETFADKVGQVVANSKGSHILFQKSGQWYISQATKFNAKEDALSTNAQIYVDPKAEYQQIFKEGWRYMRDFLYVDNVHGAPWEEVYSWYEPWLKDVRHRSDLNYLVDILSGEVAIGHSYVSGGDMPDIERVPVGLLGCDFELEGDYFRISKLYNGESWSTGLQNPLTLPGLNIQEGDYLISINGQDLRKGDNPYALLAQTANRVIDIEVNTKASTDGARRLQIKPLSSESALRTMAWVEGNRRKVETLSDGKLAYVYLPNTGGQGFQFFNRYYFAQQDKKGVILDERNNGGGSAADYMIDIMGRDIFGYFNSKANDRRPWTTPMAGIWGPKVMLINERAGSGGDLLPYMFRKKELGPLVGTRTWGGLVGTWDTPRFIDGGRMVAPRGGFFDTDGRWAVEGEGVAPDIEVIQTPKEVLEGKDPQLERGVQEALRLLEEQGEFEPKPEPKAPVRWKRAEGSR